MGHEALKLALEALEESQTDNDTMEFWDRKSKAITALKEALAQPAQEPVACVMGTYGDMFVVGPLNSSVVFPTGMALYDGPQRLWVGLTEADFSAINQSCLTKLQAATSAESILKERNS